MSRVALLREQLRVAHGFLDEVLKDLTVDQVHWSPPGDANAIGATYFHVVFGEDFNVNETIRGVPTLSGGEWTHRLGVSEPHPKGTSWKDWGRRVRVDLEALRAYEGAVRAASDAWLAALSEADLDRTLDLSGWGLGERAVEWVIGNVIVAHIHNHIGEIACLKGMQGFAGYGF